MAIRFDRDLNREIRNAVDSFNKKRNRAEARNLKYLPSKQSVKELKEEFSGRSATRTELRRRLKELQEFNLRNASQIVELESGEKTSKYNFMLATRFQRRLKRKMQKSIEEQEKYTSTHPEYIMRRSRLNLLQNIKQSLLGKITSRDVMRAVSTHYNREFSPSRVDKFHENFFEIMDLESKFIGVDKSKIDYVKKRLMEVDPDTLVKMRNNSPYISMILEKFDSDDQYNQYEIDQLNELYNRLYQNIDNIISEFTEEDYEVL